MKNKTVSLTIVIFVFGIVLLDQLSKYWAINYLIKGKPEEWIPGLIQFQLATNTGAAFNLFSNNEYLLGVISFFAVVGLILYIIFGNTNRAWQLLTLGLLLGGALGNGLDRWRLGFVVDFIAFIPINFPVLNEADLAINLGIICFILDCVSYYKVRKYG